jgi:hypothetical protein
MVSTENSEESNSNINGDKTSDADSLSLEELVQKVKEEAFKSKLLQQPQEENPSLFNQVCEEIDFEVDSQPREQSASTSELMQQPGMENQLLGDEDYEIMDDFNSELLKPSSLNQQSQEKADQSPSLLNQVCEEIEEQNTSLTNEMNKQMASEYVWILTRECMP